MDLGQLYYVIGKLLGKLHKESTKRMNATENIVYFTGGFFNAVGTILALFFFFNGNDKWWVMFTISWAIGLPLVYGAKFHALHRTGEWKSLLL